MCWSWKSNWASYLFSWNTKSAFFEAGQENMRGKKKSLIIYMLKKSVKNLIWKMWYGNMADFYAAQIIFLLRRILLSLLRKKEAQTSLFILYNSLGIY